MKKTEAKLVRLDKSLVDRGLVASRTRAVALIEEGGVRVGKEVVLEKDFLVREKDSIELAKHDLRFVSRAGLKLEHALEHWHIDPKGKIALDIGASTGGFSDVLLQKGAKKIYALDVGHGQLALKLKENKKVVNMEGVHIKDARVEDFKGPLDMIVVDVSFISLEKVIPKIKDLLKEGGILVALIKPQFEVGKKDVKKGIVTDPKLHSQVAMRIEGLIAEAGLEVEGVIASPILGGDGNKEFLLYACNKPDDVLE